MQYKPRCSGCCLQPGCIGAVFFPTGVGEVSRKGFLLFIVAVSENAVVFFT